MEIICLILIVLFCACAVDLLTHSNRKKIEPCKLHSWEYAADDKLICKVCGERPRLI